ncbi:gephyrin-like molybdotransferase Glp [Novosphingopyxis baekryungensis]|uniref:molybdopterin molybdotransferase MoeA n=1 Tax=Novosphingopyxis baekryungensis TaxID=279369 RepID=UPI0003B61DE1|nr:gephyrin-like molybdotransferase Glp [Novosphingopyxis baekryungensis]
MARRLMLSVAQAQRRILALGHPLGSETLEVARAAGRYLAAPLHAQRDQPPADNSAMDGFAIRFADLPGPWTVIGESRAGHPFEGQVAPGQATKISTGAILPDGADTVLVREDAGMDDDRLSLSGDGPAEIGRHIRRAGGDFRRGDQLLAAGQLLGPGALALAISSGLGTVDVGRRPSVTILSTGNELAAPGSLAAANQIYDSNGPMLSAMMMGLCGDVQHLSGVEDDEASVRAAIRSADNADILVTIGGASVGDHDHVKPALVAEDAALDFWKIAMKPGKPLLAGTRGRQVVIGLPGNPGSAFVTATLFLLPLLRHLAGASDPLPTVGYAHLRTALPAGGSRTEFLRAQLDNGSIAVLGAQSSGLLHTLAAADALIQRPEHAPPVEAGTIIPYIALYKGNA